MDKTSQQAVPSSAQQAAPNARRSFGFSSLRIKKRHNSYEEGGFGRRRGLLSFSSVRETSRKESVPEYPEGASQLFSTREKKTGMYEAT